MRGKRATLSGPESDGVFSDGETDRRRGEHEELRLAHIGPDGRLCHRRIRLIIKILILFVKSVYSKNFAWNDRNNETIGVLGNVEKIVETLREVGTLPTISTEVIHKKTVFLCLSLGEEQQRLGEGPRYRKTIGAETSDGCNDCPYRKRA